VKKQTFLQDRRLSRETLVLDEDRLVILTKAAGLRAEKTIDLRNLSPNYEREKRLFYSLLIVPSVFIAAMFFAIYKLSDQRVLPEEFVIAPVISLLVLLWYFIAALRPIEVTIFRGKTGAVLFEIYRPKDRAIAYDEFVAAVVENIKVKQAEQKESGRGS